MIVSLEVRRLPAMFTAAILKPASATSASAVSLTPLIVRPTVPPTNKAAMPTKARKPTVKISIGRDGESFSISACLMRVTNVSFAFLRLPKFIRATGIGAPLVAR